ncbi:MAG: hypothetical protein LBF86_06365 [Helicobacteraceae bacterium]|jgi:hypothetical protein|nr:hypothetical protein [Helicobacteraceae bacterium]
MRVFWFICVLAAALYAVPLFDDKNCKAIVFEDERADYSMGYECFYPKLTLIETYKRFKSDRMDEYSGYAVFEELRADLEVGKNYMDAREDQNGVITIQYDWENDKTLGVYADYESGDMSVRFAQTGGGTRMEVIFVSD